jgi:hypothetical protein
LFPKAGFNFIILVLTLSLSFIGERGQAAEKKFVNTVSLIEKYDDNAFTSGFRRKEDLVTTLQGQTNLTYITELSQVRLNYSILREFFMDNPELDNTSHIGTFSLDHQLTPFLQATIRDTLSITEEVEPEADPRGLRFASTRSRSRRRSNNFTLSLEPKLSNRISALIDYTNAFTDVDISEEADEKQNSYGFILRYLTDTERSNIANLSYRFSVYKYDENRRFRDTRFRPTDNFQTHALTLGYIHHFSPTLAVDIKGGVSFLSSDDPEEDDGANLVWSINLDKTWQKLHLQFNYNQDVASGGGRGRSTREKTWSGTLDYEITPKIGLNLQATYSQHDFSGSRSTYSYEDRNEDETYWSGRCSIHYQIFTWWSAQAAYHYSSSRVDSQDRGDRTYQGFDLVFLITFSRYWQLSISYKYNKRDSSGSSRAYDTGYWADNDNYERNQLWLKINFTF